MWSGLPRLVAAETGLEAPGTPDVAVVSRVEWVENNIASFSQLMAPITDRLGEQKTVGRGAAGKLMQAELGALLGFLSRRVLGQYELVLPTSDGSDGDTVMFVGANILAMERRFEFRPAEFRFWVALHESTHRLQFQGVPWLRSYFLGLVEELVNASQPEPGRMARLTEEVREAAAHGRPLVDEQGLFGLLASPTQREVIGKVQALMSLLEGHGHVVMDRIGERELVSQARMSRILAVAPQRPTNCDVHASGWAGDEDEAVRRRGQIHRRCGKASRLVSAGCRMVASIESANARGNRGSGLMAVPGGLSQSGVAVQRAVQDLADGPLVVALSGGADSAVAAWACVSGRPRGSVRAVHINHGWDASDQLEGAARDIATALELPLDVISVVAGSGPVP